MHFLSRAVSQLADNEVLILKNVFVPQLIKVLNVENLTFIEFLEILNLESYILNLGYSLLCYYE